MQAKERNSNIELLRIICMMGVVALHYVHRDIGGVEQAAAFPNFSWFFLNGVRSIAIPLVNVFVIITGYFLVHSTKFSLRKAINLILIVMLYGLVMYFINTLTSNGTINVVDLLKSMFPFFFGSSWFIRTYIILILFGPFISKLLLSLSIKNYRILLLIQILLFSVWYSTGLKSPLADDGYGIINFITLYFLGGYFGRFQKECRIIQRIPWLAAFGIYCLCVLLTAFASVFINPFGYAFITNVIGAAMLFLAVAKWTSRNVKWINLFSSKAFDVFFIHANLFVILGVRKVIDSVWMIPHILMTVVVCYLVGFVCGMVRALFMKYTTDKLLDHIPFLNKEIYL